MASGPSEVFLDDDLALQGVLAEHSWKPKLEADDAGRVRVECRGDDPKVA